MSDKVKVGKLIGVALLVGWASRRLYAGTDRVIWGKRKSARRLRR